MIASARIASSTTYCESSTSCRSSCTCCRIVFVPNRHVRRTTHCRPRDLDEHTSRQRRREPRVCSTGSRRMDARWTLPGRNWAAGARAARRPAWAASGSASWQRDALILTASSARKGSSGPPFLKRTAIPVDDGHGRPQAHSCIASRRKQASLSSAEKLADPPSALPRLRALRRAQSTLQARSFVDGLESSAVSTATASCVCSGAMMQTASAQSGIANQTRCTGQNLQQPTRRSRPVALGPRQRRRLQRAPCLGEQYTFGFAVARVSLFRRVADGGSPRDRTR